MKNKITQKEAAFYKLYTEYKKDRERYVSAWELVGEMYIEELNKWVFMSYKCPTRLTDIFLGNPNLLDRIRVIGKSGSKYYAYRFKESVSPDSIDDPFLRGFYLKVKSGVIKI